MTRSDREIVRQLPTAAAGSVTALLMYAIWGGVDDLRASCTGDYCELGPVFVGTFIAPIVVVIVAWIAVRICSHRRLAESLGVAAIGCLFGGLVVEAWVRLNYGSTRPPFWYCVLAGALGFAAAVAVIDGTVRARRAAVVGIVACVLVISTALVVGPARNGLFAAFADILLKPDPAKFTVVAGTAYPSKGFVLLKVEPVGGGEAIALIESRWPDVWDPPSRCGQHMRTGLDDDPVDEPCEPYDGGGYQRGSGWELLDTHGITLVEVEGWVIGTSGSTELMRSIITSLVHADPSDLSGLPLPNDGFS
jgi:hypothetical protein